MLLGVKFNFNYAVERLEGLKRFTLICFVIATILAGAMRSGCIHRQVQIIALSFRLFAACPGKIRQSILQIFRDLVKPTGSSRIFIGILNGDNARGSL